MEGRDQNSPTPDGGWQYRPETTPGESLTPGFEPQLQSVTTQWSGGDARAVDWSASEFIAHEKSIGWYLVLGVITLVGSALAFLISRDWITVIIFILVAIILGVAAGRKPRQMSYRVDDGGFSISGRTMPYSSFRSFSIVEEGPFANLVFLPLKRFMPITSAYVDPKDEESIIAVIADYLPIEEHRADLIERLMHRIRF